MKKRNFKNIRSTLSKVDDKLLISGVDGIVMDLGMSSMQSDDVGMWRVNGGSRRYFSGVMTNDSGGPCWCFIKIWQMPLVFSLCCTVWYFHNFTTIICIDISDYMGHHDSPKYLAQLDALELYLQLIIKPCSDHYVGVYGLAGIFGSLIVEPTNTNDISDIMMIVRCSHICMRGEIFVNSALNKIMDLHKDVLTRMVVFIGGILDEAKKRERMNTCGLLKEIYGIEESARHMNELIHSIRFPVGEEKEEVVRRRVEELGIVYGALKNGLHPLEKQVRSISSNCNK
nr:uncharacterized protein [Tanacetum cinerariifolium]